MNNDSDFFGDVFDDPEDDPLLGGEDASSDHEAGGESEPQGPPSWMADEHRTNGEAPSSDASESKGPEQKQIVVNQDGGNGIEELNQAVGQGWRLVRISLARPNGEQVASAHEAYQFVATLEQESPQSLFDFG